MHGWLSARTPGAAHPWAPFAGRIGNGIILALPLSVAFGALAAWQVHGINITATDALVALLVMLNLGRADEQPIAGDGVSQWRPSFAPYPLLFSAIVALITLMTLSLAWAPDRALALKEALKWGEALAVLGFAPRYLRRPGMVARLIAVVLAVAVAEACLGGLQATVFVAGQHVAADRGVRVVGTFGQPNPYAGALNLALPLALALLGWARGTLRWLLLAAGGALLAALLLAQSRGALLGLRGAVAAMAWLGWPPLRRWLAGGAAAALAGVALALATGRLTTAALLARLGWRPLTDAALSADITDANFSTVERLAHWAAAWRMFLAHPLTGVGAGNYAIAYAAYAVPRWPLALGHAHNLALHLLAELGIGGLLCYLAIVATSIWLLLHTWQRAVAAAQPPTPQSLSPFRVFRGISWFACSTVPQSFASCLSLGMLGAQIAMVIQNGFDDLTTHSLLVAWALLLACSQSLPLDRLIRGEQPESER